MSGNGFLGGRIVAVQPEDGFRAGHDTVLLAAAVPALAGQHVLELGAGAGIASLCLAARVPDVRILGVELDPALVTMADANAAANGMESRVSFVAGDVAAFVGDGTFDHVFFNPPFHPVSGRKSRDPARDLAMRDTAGAIAAWTRVALAAVKQGGTVTATLRADRKDEMLAAATGMGVVVFPLFPRLGVEPKRVIVRIEKNASAGLRTATGLTLHEADGRNTQAAEAVLRHAAALDWD